MSTNLFFQLGCGGRLVLSVEQGLLCATKDNDAATAIHTILTTQYTHTCTVVLTFLLFDGRSYSTVELAQTTEKDFQDWMMREGAHLAPEPERNPPIELLNGVPVERIFVDEASGPLPPAPAPRKPGCPECYDTGYRHGFGAPCSHGCRP